jgi:hypothetical protein
MKNLELIDPILNHFVVRSRRLSLRVQLAVESFLFDDGDEINTRIAGAPVAHLDGGRRGLAPPPPRGGPVRAYFVEPRPPPTQRRRV